MPRRSKPTLEDKLLADCYKQLLRETGKVPTVAEVQQRYREKFGNNK
jgi:hypothetical protein